MFMRTLLAGLCFLGLELTIAAAEPAAATVADDGKEVVLDNGVVSLTLTKHGGRGTSIKYKIDGHEFTLAEGRSILYFDAGGGKAYPIAEADAQIVRTGPDLVEVMWAGKASDAFPFDTEMHCVLRRGESGFHLYAVYHHGAGMAAGGVGETRFVVKGPPGTDLFTHHVVDDRRKGPYPTAKTTSQVQDATWLLDDGSYYTKYDNSAYLAEHRVHGMAGHGVGVWMIFPSNEFIGGGPFKQELTVHKENTLLAMLVGGHFGSGGLRFAEGESWDKVYGPVFVYVNNGESVDAMWADAKKRADVEVAQWPCDWLENKEYPRERGTVAGTIRLTDGGSAKDAWVILSPPGEDWTQVLKGYDFWTRADAEGRFKLTKVRPGKYTLRAIGADQFEEFRRDDVQVEPGKDADLGELKWEPIKHGRRLWQIGVADRSSQEFKGGDDPRHYDNFLRYAKAFPEDVTFTVGKSKEADDWNFAQWSIYSKKPAWSVLFDLPDALKGKATLTIGFTSANPPKGKFTNLQVKVNSTEVDVVHLPKTGTAGYRSGGSDSPYHVVTISFDAGLLRKGENEITLGHAEAEPLSGHKGGVPGEVMYDALRLEVDSAAADKPGPADAAADRPTLFIIGDSTVNNHTEGLQGWGDPITAYFDKSKIKVENRARGGRSSRSYRTEGLWDEVLAALKPGDFVLMQFGHNDGGPVTGGTGRASLKGTGEETQEIVDEKTGAKEIVHTYGWYIRKYAAEAKTKGATAVVLSPAPRNIWTDDGKVARAANDYGKWAAEAAKAEGAYFIDLNDLVARRYEDAGQEKVKKLYFGEDHTHTTPAGAEINAAAVVEGLKGLKDCPLSGLLK